MKEAALLDGAAALESNRPRMAADAARNMLSTLSADASPIARSVRTRRGSCQMRNVFGNWVL
jgi:hypothetical protein